MQVSRSRHFYCFGDNEVIHKKHAPLLGKFFEPFLDLFFHHALPAHDETSDDLCDPIAKAGGIIRTG
jgi:hypothetical protein